MYKEHRKTYTDDEYIVRMWEKEYLQDLAARFMYAWSNGERREALDKYWVQKTHNQRDASFGVNNGFYVGMDEVVRHLVAQYEEECKADLKAFQEARPEKGYTGADLGLGKTLLHDCTTPLLYIADDGETAKGIFNIRGSYNKVTVSGPIAYWIFGWAAVDFVREADGWKIWHMQWLQNVNAQCGTPFGVEPEQFPAIEAYADMASFRMPEPTVKTCLMENYYTDRPFTKSPKVPEPYETFSDTFSYGM